MAQFATRLMDRQRLEPARNAYHAFVTLPLAGPSLAYRYLTDRGSFYESARAESGPLMRILYFADIRFPLERANGIQTMETCHALAERGHTVHLVVKPDTHSAGARSVRVLRTAAASSRWSSSGPTRRRAPGSLARVGYLSFAFGRAFGKVARRRRS